MQNCAIVACKYAKYLLQRLVNMLNTSCSQSPTSIIKKSKTTNTATVFLLLQLLFPGVNLLCLCHQTYILTDNVCRFNIIVSFAFNHCAFETAGSDDVYSLLKQQRASQCQYLINHERTYTAVAAFLFPLFSWHCVFKKATPIILTIQPHSLHQSHYRFLGQNQVIQGKDYLSVMYPNFQELLGNFQGTLAIFVYHFKNDILHMSSYCSLTTEHSES